jgi:fermentation-respiration switch protein FrsA (DUF1100 family)
MNQERDVRQKAPGKSLPQPLPAWWRILRVLLVGYLLILLLMMFFENSLIFIPTKYPGGWWEPRGLKVEDANFTAADGTKLHGWFVASQQPEVVILFCHGNAGNITHRVDLMETLPQYVDVSLLVFDYRGYGKSEGSPNEVGVLADARAARAWLANRTGVAESGIVLMGESLGGAVAVDLAAEDGTRGLVLEDSFTSLPDVAAYHYPWLPVRWLMRSKLNSLEKIRKYHGPLLVAHGDVDTIIPYAFGKQLFQAANEPKQFITQHNADHNDPRDEEFYERLGKFLKSLPASR